MKPFSVYDRLRATYTSMKQRCYNINCVAYAYYGAKGIGVCDEWRESCSKFKEWALNNGYDDTLTIDRIDPKSHYCPENCRWITLSENARRAHVVMVTAWGESKSLKEWAKDTRSSGLSATTIRNRIREGWEPQDAISKGAQYSTVLLPDTRVLEVWGETKTIREWLKDDRCAVKSREALLGRIKMGWCNEDVISRPVRPKTPFVQLEAWSETKTLKEWLKDSRCVVTKLSTLHGRLWAGKSPEDALSTPVRK